MLWYVLVAAAFGVVLWWGGRWIDRRIPKWAAKVHHSDVFGGPDIKKAGMEFWSGLVLILGFLAGIVGAIAAGVNAYDRWSK